MEELEEQGLGWELGSTTGESSKKANLL
ncbi:hypothetical protein SBV1_2330023 [Verrucomicrobia bacterium]|nr:hypothetical protein SBV1_2330023 [Verrucomicrobiota bacterium]